MAAPQQLEAMFDTLEQRFGRVLVLVNNAGVRADGLAPQICDGDWDLVLDTNLTAAFRGFEGRPMRCPLSLFAQF